MLRLFVAVVVLGLVPAPVHAKSCVRRAAETMDLVRLEVRSEGVVVAAPPGLGEFDELLASGGQQVQDLLMWRHDGEWKIDAKWFGYFEASEPSAVQRDYLEALKHKRLMTSCGYSVSVAPVRPGSYRFTQDYDGSAQSAGVDVKRLVVAPDRQRVTLEFAVAGRDHVAVYEVACAHHDWDPEAKQCGPKEAQTEPPPPSPGPSVEPPRIAAPPPAIEGPPPADPGARGCAVATGDPPGLLALVLLLARRRRRRRAKTARP